MKKLSELGCSPYFLVIWQFVVTAQFDSLDSNFDT